MTTTTPTTSHHRVALVGNPNTGKTTLFNALTGLSQRVGNYPGVTVERKTGTISDAIEIVDLPGTYSLAASSPDELIVIRALLGDLPGEERPSLIVAVLDATNLRRNLYLATQVLDLGLPTVFALNMMDDAERQGIELDVPALEKSLGAPIVPIVAARKKGLDELKDAIKRRLDEAPPGRIAALDADLERDAQRLAADFGVAPYLALRALIDETGPVESELIRRADGERLQRALVDARTALTSRHGSLAALEATSRYGWIQGTLAGAVRRTDRSAGWTDRIDAVLTHRVLGLVAFVAVMGTVFLSIFRWAGPLMDAIDGAFGWLSGLASGAFAGTALEGGLLESLLVDGVIAGVGGVLIFLPQIALLFVFIAILEDCGYMARAAFLMDRLLRWCGLSGHSFIPMLSSFACAIPGILAARSIGSTKDRLVTILVAPLMSCSARIPVYTIVIGALIPATTFLGLPVQGLVFAAMYFVGVLAAVLVALVLRLFLVRGEPSTFVMELPPYRMPVPRAIGMRAWHASKAFVTRAGTIIFAMSILVWALATFPRSDSLAEQFEDRRSEAAATLDGEEREERIAEIDREEATAQLDQSALGRIGHAIEPAVEPLGWDWKMGTAAVAAFPAREVVVSALNILYGLDEEDEGEGLTERLSGEVRADGSPKYGVPVALSIMVFVALCAQCMSTLAVMARETGSWKWPVFAFVYMTALAWIGAFVAYQGALALGL